MSTFMYMLKKYSKEAITKCRYFGIVKIKF